MGNYFDPFILSILESRNIDSIDKAEKFLNPSLENISSPFLMMDIDKAADRILSAIDLNEKICIYGDYDVDGITSTSLCILALQNINCQPDYYIPLRDEGYGLNKDAVKSLADNNVKLLITVDCGISSVDEIAYANSLGMDVIVTDHHEINNELPPAFAVINPKRSDNEYTFKSLAGVGTAFMLLYALYTRLDIAEDIFEFIDIVAIGTVADIVPLIEDNRIIVKEGLSRLIDSKNLGLRILLYKLYKTMDNLSLNTYSIGFQIAPVFNAAGRLEDAKQAVELLVTKDKLTAEGIAEKLISQNKERKSIQNDILEKVEHKITSSNLDKNPVIICYDYGFHHGVIGIVASKIVDKYYRPTILLELKEDGTAVASCRSIDGFDIIKALDSMKELFLKYGGHAGAAGFSISIENIEKFEKEINAYTSKNIDLDTYVRPVYISGELTSERISYDFYKTLENLAPFGFGNPTPIFLLRNVDISSQRLVGSDKSHLMFNISKNNKTIKNCIWFSKAHNLKHIGSNSKYDIAFKLKCEEYKGKYYTKIFTEDIKTSTLQENKNIYYYILKNTSFPLDSIAYTRKTVKKGDWFDIDVEKAQLLLGRSVFGFLSADTNSLLLALHKFYSYKFYAIVSNIHATEDHYQLSLKIYRNYDIASFSSQDAKVFSDIKEFLIGDFDYNSLQKKALNILFRKKQNVAITAKNNLGINTIALTMAIYHYLQSDTKSFYATNDAQKFKNTVYSYYFDFEKTDTQSSYSFYYFDNVKPFDIPKNSTALLYSKQNLNTPDFISLEDSSKLSQFIKLLDNMSIFDKNKYPFEIFSNYLPRKDRLIYLKKIKNNENLYATSDIFVLL